MFDFGMLGNVHVWYMYGTCMVHVCGTCMVHVWYMYGVHVWCTCMVNVWYTLCNKGCYMIRYNSAYGDVIRNIMYNVSIRTVIHTYTYV